MQQPTEKVAVLKALKFKASWLPYIVLVSSVSLTLIGVFVLSEWAELSGWHHAAQHVIIFLSGCGAGTSVFSMIKTKKEN